MRTTGSLDAWPFLMARGRAVGSTLVLSPSFLLDQGDASLIARLDGSETDEDLRPMIATFVDSTGTSLTFAHAWRHLTWADLASGSGDSRMLHDAFGRPIIVRYGFVVIDTQLEVVDPRDMSKAWVQAVDAYRRLFQSETTFETERSLAFSLVSPAVAQKASPTVEVDPPKHNQPTRHLLNPRPRSPAMLVGTFVVFLLLASSLVVRLWLDLGSDSLVLAGPLVVGDPSTEQIGGEPQEISSALVQLDVCVYLADSSGELWMLPIWPEGTTWATEEGVVVGPNGTDVQLGSREVFLGWEQTAEAVATRIDEEIREHMSQCLAPVGGQMFFVSSI